MNVRWINGWLMLAVVAVPLTLTGCVAGQQQKPSRTPLDIQSIQTREYEAAKKIVFGSVVSVFQDLGYTIKGADLETGFINAESAAQNNTFDSAGGLFIEVLVGAAGGGGSPSTSTQNTEQTIATAFLEEIGGHDTGAIKFCDDATVILSAGPK